MARTVWVGTLALATVAGGRTDSVRNMSLYYICLIQVQLDVHCILYKYRTRLFNLVHTNPYNKTSTLVDTKTSVLHKSKPMAVRCSCAPDDGRK
jgi:hypothetical protein